MGIGLQHALAATNHVLLIRPLKQEFHRAFTRWRTLWTDTASRLEDSEVVLQHSGFQRHSLEVARLGETLLDMYQCRISWASSSRDGHGDQGKECVEQPPAYLGKVAQDSVEPLHEFLAMYMMRYQNKQDATKDA